MYYISSELEENEREETFRLKRFKQLKDKNTKKKNLQNLPEESITETSSEIFEMGAENYKTFSDLKYNVYPCDISLNIDNAKKFKYMFSHVDFFSDLTKKYKKSNIESLGDISPKYDVYDKYMEILPCDDIEHDIDSLFERNQQAINRATEMIEDFNDKPLLGDPSNKSQENLCSSRVQFAKSVSTAESSKLNVVTPCEFCIVPPCAYCSKSKESVNTSFKLSHDTNRIDDNLKSKNVSTDPCICKDTYHTSEIMQQSKNLTHDKIKDSINALSTGYMSITSSEHPDSKGQLTHIDSKTISAKYDELKTCQNCMSQPCICCDKPKEGAGSVFEVSHNTMKQANDNPSNLISVSWVCDSIHGNFRGNQKTTSLAYEKASIYDLCYSSFDYSESKSYKYDEIMPCEFCMLVPCVCCDKPTKDVGSAVQLNNKATKPEEHNEKSLANVSCSCKSIDSGFGPGQKSPNILNEKISTYDVNNKSFKHSKSKVKLITSVLKISSSTNKEERPTCTLCMLNPCGCCDKSKEGAGSTFELSHKTIGQTKNNITVLEKAPRACISHDILLQLNYDSKNQTTNKISICDECRTTFDHTGITTKLTISTSKLTSSEYNMVMHCKICMSIPCTCCDQSKEGDGSVYETHNKTVDRDENSKRVFKNSSNVCDSFDNDCDLNKQTRNPIHKNTSFCDVCRKSFEYPGNKSNASVLLSKLSSKSNDLLQCQFCMTEPCICCNIVKQDAGTVFNITHRNVKGVEGSTDDLSNVSCVCESIDSYYGLSTPNSGVLHKNMSLCDVCCKSFKYLSSKLNIMCPVSNAMSSKSNELMQCQFCMSQPCVCCDIVKEDAGTVYDFSHKNKTGVNKDSKDDLSNISCICESIDSNFSLCTQTRDVVHEKISLCDVCRKSFKYLGSKLNTTCPVTKTMSTKFIEIMPCQFCMSLPCVCCDIVKEEAGTVFNLSHRNPKENESSDKNVSNALCACESINSTYDLSDLVHDISLCDVCRKSFEYPGSNLKSSASKTTSSNSNDSVLCQFCMSPACVCNHNQKEDAGIAYDLSHRNINVVESYINDASDTSCICESIDSDYDLNDDTSVIVHKEISLCDVCRKSFKYSGSQFKLMCPVSENVLSKFNELVSCTFCMLQPCVCCDNLKEGAGSVYEFIHQSPKRSEDQIKYLASTSCICDTDDSKMIPQRTDKLIEDAVCICKNINRAKEVVEEFEKETKVHNMCDKYIEPIGRNMNLVHLITNVVSAKFEEVLQCVFCILPTCTFCNKSKEDDIVERNRQAIIRAEEMVEDFTTSVTPCIACNSGEYSNSNITLPYPLLKSTTPKFDELPLYNNIKADVDDICERNRKAIIRAEEMIEDCTTTQLIHGLLGHPSKKIDNTISDTVPGCSKCYDIPVSVFCQKVKDNDDIFHRNYQAIMRAEEMIEDCPNAPPSCAMCNKTSAQPTSSTIKSSYPVSWTEFQSADDLSSCVFCERAEKHINNIFERNQLAIVRAEEMVEDIANFSVSCDFCSKPLSNLSSKMQTPCYGTRAVSFKFDDLLLPCALCVTASEDKDNITIRNQQAIRRAEEMIEDFTLGGEALCDICSKSLSHSACTVVSPHLVSETRFSLSYGLPAWIFCGRVKPDTDNIFERNLQAIIRAEEMVEDFEIDPFASDLYISKETNNNILERNLQAIMRAEEMIEDFSTAPLTCAVCSKTVDYSDNKSKLVSCLLCDKLNEGSDSTFERNLVAINRAKEMVEDFASMPFVCNICNKDTKNPCTRETLQESDVDIASIISNNDIDSTFPVNQAIDGKIGYFEKEFKETTKITRLKNVDGSVSEEKKVITVRTERRNPRKTNISSEDCHVQTVGSYDKIKNKSTTSRKGLSKTAYCNINPRGTKSENIKCPQQMGTPKLRSCVSALNPEIPMNKVKSSNYSAESYSSTKSIRSLSKSSISLQKSCSVTCNMEMTSPINSETAASVCGSELYSCKSSQISVSPCRPLIKTSSAQTCGKFRSVKKHDVDKETCCCFDDTNFKSISKAIDALWRDTLTSTTYIKTYSDSSIAKRNMIKSNSCCTIKPIAKPKICSSETGSKTSKEDKNDLMLTNSIFEFIRRLYKGTQPTKTEEPTLKAVCKSCCSRLNISSSSIECNAPPIPSTISRNSWSTCKICQTKVTGSVASKVSSCTYCGAFVRPSYAGSISFAIESSTSLPTTAGCFRPTQSNAPCCSCQKSRSNTSQSLNRTPPSCCDKRDAVTWTKRSDKYDVRPLRQMQYRGCPNASLCDCKSYPHLSRSRNRRPSQCKSFYENDFRYFW